MRFVEVYPLPEVCAECIDRKECLAKGEGEWCCDECDHLGDRFTTLPEKPDSYSRREEQTK